MTDPVYAVVLAGGGGTRLWPASRRRRPKQFLPLAPGGQTLLAATVGRVRTANVTRRLTSQETTIPTEMPTGRARNGETAAPRTSASRIAASVANAKRPASTNPP